MQIIKKLKKIPLNVITYLFNWEWRTKKTNFIQKSFTFLFLQRRASLPLTDITRLSKKIPFRMFIVRTFEIHKGNEWYGAATILKQYAQADKNVSLKATLEHGFYPSDDIFVQDRKSKLPLMITMGDKRAAFLSKETGKKSLAIGPYICYAKKHFNSFGFNREKKRLGRNLLVFPLHSTGVSKAHYNKKRFCEKIREIAKDFDSIRICVYWKDVLHGASKYFQKQGFECVTAGYMLDPLFLPRLRSIIELSDYTVSLDVGTHVGYCVALNKPHYIIGEKHYYAGIDKEELAIHYRGERASCYKEILKAFSRYEKVITKEQYSIINRYWGLDRIRSQKELLSIFSEAEKLYEETTPRGPEEI